MKPIILIGCRQTNRHIIAAAESCGQKIIGLVDRFYVGQIIDGLPVIASDLDLLDPSSELYQTKDDYDWFITTFFTGITNVKNDNENTWLLKKQRADIANRANINLINIQHANSYVDPTCELGKNLFIGWGCYLDAYCKIGNYNFFGMNCGIGHHSTTGDFCSFTTTTVCGNTQIGKNVLFGFSTTIAKRSKSEITIGNNVIISPGVTILDPVKDNLIVFPNGRTRINTQFVM